MSPFRWNAVIVGVVSLAAVAGCGGGGGGSAADAPVATASAGQSTGSVTASPAGSATPGPSGSPTGGPTGAAGQGSADGDGSAKTAPAVPAASRCHTKGLKVELAGQGTGAGERSATLVFTNKGRKSCKISGWPRLVLATAEQPFDTRIVRQGTGKAVTVAAGKKAYTRLSWTAVAASDETGSQCQPTAGFLQIFPPDEKEWLLVQWKGGPVCQHNRLEVSAFAKGAGA